MTRHCKACHGAVVVRKVSGRFPVSYRHLFKKPCSAMTGALDILPEDKTYSIEDK